MHIKKHSDNNSPLRQLHGKAKLHYLWDYYKLPALLAAYAYASSTKILAALDSKRLDIIFMNQESLDAMTSEGYLMNLPDSLLETSDYSSDSSYAINLSDTPLIQSAGFTEPLYIGIAANSTHIKEAISYIGYIKNASDND